jgi:OOP family OmpA-OmpF porin
MNKLLCTGVFLFGLCLGLQAQQPELIKSIFFGGGSYYIDSEQVAEIRAFVEAIPDPENYQIAISSHTDNIGGVQYNQWLSEQRSESVIQQLENNLVPREKVLRQDNGQLNPWFDNSTTRGRQANRRVDIIFTPLFL